MVKDKEAKRERVWERERGEREKLKWINTNLNCVCVFDGKQKVKVISYYQ